MVWALYLLLPGGILGYYIILRAVSVAQGIGIGSTGSDEHHCTLLRLENNIVATLRIAKLTVVGQPLPIGRKQALAPLRQ